MTKHTVRLSADQPFPPGNQPRTSVVFSVISAAASRLALAWVVAEQLPEGVQVVVIGPGDLLRQSLDRWPPRVKLVELSGRFDSAEQRRDGATAATGDLIRFIDVGGSERSVDPQELTLGWADRLRLRKAGPP